jgi:hypothetical protein
VSFWFAVRLFFGQEGYNVLDYTLKQVLVSNAHIGVKFQGGHTSFNDTICDKFLHADAVQVKNS